MSDSDEEYDDLRLYLTETKSPGEGYGEDDQGADSDYIPPDVWSDVQEE